MVPNNAVDQCVLHNIFIEWLIDHAFLNFYVNFEGLKYTRS